jgi:hypothetical protein
LLGFAWYSLAETGLFNGLQRIQIKKSFPSQAILGMFRPRSYPSSERRAVRQWFLIRRPRKKVWHNLWFGPSNCRARIARSHEPLEGQCERPVIIAALG